MDRPAPPTPSQREIMFCHNCENEWYRDEHGIVCPECGGDFCEVIEAGNDPREALRIPQDTNDWAPDPDEDDIDQFNEPHEQFRARFERTRSQDSQVQAQQGGGLMGFLGNAFRLASEVISPGPHPPNAEHEEAEGQAQAQSPSQTTTQQTSPSNGGTTFTRHVHGNGFSLTMTTTSTNNLQPRDPSNPQPFQRQPQNIDEMMQQILGNIGVFSPGMQAPHAHAGFGPAGFMFNDPHTIPGGPSPFPAGLFQMLGLPVGGIHGDAVYSQEGLDRIISQLMEQHQTGNAPGPASESAIDSLPQRAITEKDLGESGTADCSICMESVALGDKVTVLPCDHWFHHDCVKAWLQEHDTCPHCRQGIMPRGDANATAPRQPSQAPLNDMHSPRNTRATVPGGYPFPQQSTRPGQSNGLFDRMRDTFGGNGSSTDDRS